MYVYMYTHTHTHTHTQHFNSKFNTLIEIIKLKQIQFIYIKSSINFIIFF